MFFRSSRIRLWLGKPLCPQSFLTLRTSNSHTGQEVNKRSCMKKGILVFAMLLLTFSFVYAQTSSSSSTTDPNAATSSQQTTDPNAQQSVPPSAQPVDPNQAQQNNVPSTSAGGNATSTGSQSP